MVADMFNQPCDFAALGEFLYPHAAPRADFFDDDCPNRARHLYWRTRDAMRAHSVLPASESPFVETGDVSRIHLDRRYVLTDLRVFAIRRDEARQARDSDDMAHDRAMKPGVATGPDEPGAALAAGPGADEGPRGRRPSR